MKMMTKTRGPKRKEQGLRKAREPSYTLDAPAYSAYCVGEEPHLTAFD